jgi:hypothetical protein
VRGDTAVLPRFRQEFVMRIRLALACAAAGFIIPAVPAPAHAQDGFLFQPPRVQLTLRGGLLQHSARSDFFDWAVDTLTIQRHQFRSPVMGLDVGYLAGRHFDVVIGIGYGESERGSEYRHWDEWDIDPATGDTIVSPIRQSTRIRAVPVHVGVRYRPLPRGRTLSELAWLPGRTSPYVGAGGGMTWYRLVQEGDFIDAGLNIFEDSLESSGSGLVGHVAAGVDHWLTPRLGANLEARYSVGSAGMNQERFRGFDDLDLGGLQVTLGISLRW